MFVSTHVSLPTMPRAPVGADKVFHFNAFLGLGFLTALWLALGGKATISRLLLLLAVLAIYAGIDEWLQQFVNRHTDINDWLADLSGAAIGIAALWALQAFRPLVPGERSTA